MKVFYFLQFILLLLINYTGISQNCQGLFREVSLTERLTNSSTVVEAKVISKSYFWDVTKKNIYTSCTVKVYNQLKGNNKTTLELVFLGGTLDAKTQTVSDSPNLKLGDQGIFFLKKANYPIQKSNVLKLVASVQGYIKIDSKNDTAKDLFKKYPSITTLKSQLEKIDGDTWLQIQNKPSAKVLAPSATAATPIISSFSPTTATAGTKTTLTISGSNFGTTIGSVGFADANDGGASFYEALNSEVITWSDTSITVNVPWRAGNGNINVTNSDSETGESSTALSVTYAYSNISNGDGSENYPTILTNQNGEGGLTFKYHTSFDTSPAKELFEEAFQLWNCETGVNFNFGETTTVDDTSNDGESIVRFDNTLEIGVLGRAITYTSLFCPTDQTLTSTQIDIVWNSTINWYYGDATPAPSQFDFKSVALHELGHALQLGHVIEPSAAMHFAVNPGESRFSITANEIQGALFTTNKFYSGNLCGSDTMDAESYCCDDTTIDENPSNVSVSEGQNASFLVSENLVDSYQWQIFNGTSWENLTDTPPYTGTTTEQLTITSVTSAMDNDQFRVLLNRSCGDTLETVPAVLDVSTTTSDTNAFITSWNTENDGTSANNEITIPTNPAFTYNYTVDWGDGQSDTNVIGDITHTYLVPGSQTVSITGNFPAIYFNNTGDNEKLTTIIQWGIIEWQSMESAFYGCNNMIYTATDNPDLTNATSLAAMFKNATSFNGIIRDWDVTTILNMSEMFYGASIFNRVLSDWNVINVQNMSAMFQNAGSYNEPLENWEVDNVTDMSHMFDNAVRFNQVINNWNVGSVTNMSAMFDDADDFNRPINDWDVSKVTDMSNMFYNFIGGDFNQPLDEWDVGEVLNMSRMFGSAVSNPFNQNINDWNVEKVTDMSNMFENARNFDQPLNQWIVSSVTDMESTFENARAFNQPLNDWDVSSVVTMRNMFRGATAFAQELDQWVVDNVTNMARMFNVATNFNSNINNWNIDQVTNLSSMFQSATNFNQPLNGWNVNLVTNMSSMFSDAALFNQPLTNWTLNTSNNINMSSMFSGATAFDQNLGGWDIQLVTNMSDMLNNSGLSKANYDATLIEWSTKTVSPNVSLGAVNVAYCDSEVERQKLIDTDGWTITGDQKQCDALECTTLISPANGEIDVPDNFNLSWNAIFSATGYTITISVGASELVSNEDVGNQTTYNVNETFNDGDVVSVVITPYNDDGPITEICDAETFTVVPFDNSTSFITTWDTTLSNIFNQTSPPNQLDIDTNSSFTYDYTIDWGDGFFDSNVTGDISHVYDTPGIYTVTITGTFPAIVNSTFDDAPKLLTIEQWGTIEWQSMRSAFSGCENMTYNATDIPDLSQVTDIGSMFLSCNLFNGNIDNWDVSTVTNMSSTFFATDAFNQPLNSWIVDNVTNMANMFRSTDIFNQPLNNWNVDNVTSMEEMFRDAGAFNEALNDWNVSSVTTMEGMFYRAEVFNQPLDNWADSVTNVTNMTEMFRNATAFSQSISNWKVDSVTTMQRMFQSASSFNSPLNNWNVDNVTNMESMFSSAISFDQPINDWDTSEVTTMASMFSNATSFNQPLDQWGEKVSKVTNMASMFRSTGSFNQPLNNWNVSSVTTMVSMFENSVVFNGDISDWDVERVTTMESMFESAEAFDKTIENWTVTSVITMESMFEDALVFNQPLANWNMQSVANTVAMFKNSKLFNQPIDSWTVDNVTIMSSMFEGAEAFDQPIGGWNVDKVTLMDSMFENALVFNQPLDTWEVDLVQNMSSMFENATVFNQDLNSWNTSRVTTMNSMFSEATVFNGIISNWNTERVTDMAFMFNEATEFNQPISDWEVSNVTTMRWMFRNATAYNQPMNLWNVASVTTMESMFEGASMFNESIDDWNVRAVTTMESMFERASTYNQSVNSWQVVGVTDMESMFDEAIAYSQPMDGWNIGTVSMRRMFEDATSFNQYLGDWDITSVTNMSNMLDDTALTLENYDNTIIAWSEQTLPTGLTLGARNVPYCECSNARQSIIDTYSWNFSGDVLACPIPLCTQLISPENNEIDVPVNANLSWEPVLYAINGYKVTVRTVPGGTIVNEEVVTDTAYEFTSNFSGGESVFVTITPFNDTGDASSCTEENFTITSAPATVPECTTLTEPIADAVDISVSTDISWNPVSNADTYFLSVGTSPGGTDIVNNEDVGNVTTYNFDSDLPENETIYVTITPNNEEGDALTCAEESFTTEVIPIAPLCTTLLNPTNGASDVPKEATISWNAIDNAVGYLVSIGSMPGEVDIANSIDIEGATFIDLDEDLPENQTIYITIIPYNDIGDASGCAEESFSTDTVTDPPLCTNLTTPTNGAIDIPIDTNLTWSAAPLAAEYIISVGTSSGGIDIVDNETVATNEYDFATNLAGGTQYFVTITPTNTIGNATGCTEESFTTETAPDCTSLSSPTNGAVDIPITANLTWNTSAKAIEYIVSVGTTTGGVDIVDNETVTTNEYNFGSNLDGDTEYFVTITPTNAVGQATGCSEESFTTETAPDCTTLSSPANEAIDIPITTNLTWNTSVKASEYIVSVGTTTGGIDIVDNETVTTNEYNFAANLAGNTEYFVTITPTNSVGQATGCTEESFTTETAPGCTTLSTPTNNGAIDVQITSNLTWNVSTKASEYIVSVGTTSGGIDVVDNETVSTNEYDFVNDLAGDTEYFVTIIPTNAVGQATGCSEESFTTETIPDCTSLNTPLDGTTDVIVTTNLTWNTSAKASRYIVTVGTNPGGNDVVDNETTINNEYIFRNNLEGDTTYFITIIPTNIVGNAIGCTEESFTTEPAPDCTNISSSLTDIPLTNGLITWDAVPFATGYTISISSTPSANDIISNEDLGNDTSYTITENLENNTNYYVLITPYNNVGAANFCDEEPFSTITTDQTKYGLSPNDDGINDFWEIDKIEEYPDNEVLIYNRWGTLVFRTKNYDNSFNVFNGNANQLTNLGAGELKSGTYFFEIKIDGEHDFNKTKGFLVLKR